MSTVKEIVNAITAALPKHRPIRLHEPSYGSMENTYLHSALMHGVTRYEYVDLFEKTLVKRLATEELRVFATNTGTAALHLALMAIGVEPGDEVIVPNLTFAGTAAAVRHAGAIPHFLDCSWNMAPFKLKAYLARSTMPRNDRIGRDNPITGRRIRAVIAVHLLGVPADIAGIVKAANAFGLDVIEDACEALGSKINGKACGTFGRAGVFSFNSNKIVTTNGGGALVTTDPWVFARAHMLGTTCRVQHSWKVEHDGVGWNYRMPNLNAAFGVGQLERLDEVLETKVRLGKLYSEHLASVGGVSFAPVAALSGGIPNNWLFALKVPKEIREELLNTLHMEGIEARALFTPLHQLQPYQECPRYGGSMGGRMIESEDTFETTICLPSGANLI